MAYRQGPFSVLETPAVSTQIPDDVRAALRWLELSEPLLVEPVQPLNLQRSAVIQNDVEHDRRVIEP